MKTYKALFFLLVLVVIPDFLQAQEILIQWTGSVRDELLNPVPFAHIIEKKDYRGTIADPEGRFTIIAYPNDTLYITSIGFKPKTVITPNVQETDSKHILQDIFLQEDTVFLSEVVIFPWKTYNEFKEAFLALDMPEDDLKRAYSNINLIQSQMAQNILSRQTSPTASFRDMMAARNNKLMNMGHILPTYSITNPLAWAQFFMALKNGEFKKKYQPASSKTSSLVEIINSEQNKEE